MEKILSNKNIKCKGCGENKPLDSFVKVVHTLYSSKKNYQCIDCKVNSLYENYEKKSKKKNITIPKEEINIIKRAFKFLFGEVD